MVEPRTRPQYTCQHVAASRARDGNDLRRTGRGPITMRQPMPRKVRLFMRVSYRCALALAMALPQASAAADGSACNDELAQIHGDRGEIAARGEAVAMALDQFEACAR